MNPDRTAKVKIKFELDPKDEQGYETESVWADPLGGNQFRILNSPFFFFGVSFDDIVEAQQDGSAYRFEKVVRRGRHSTYRIFLQNDYTISDEVFREYWEPISKTGSTFENGNDRVVAVDIPPEANVSEVYRLLKKGEEEGVWVFEEAHYAGE